MREVEPNPPDTDPTGARGTGALVGSSAGGSSTGRQENGAVAFCFVFHSTVCAILLAWSLLFVTISKLVN